MPDVSKLNLDGTTYKIKDDDARKYLVVVNNTSQDATKVNITTSDDVVELALQSDLDSAIASEASARESAIASEASAREVAITEEATERSNQIAALQAAVGSPLVAATASAMTDKTKIYVYTGSESGKTAGHWYYWNGSAWTDGGVYNSTALETDKTLSVSNMAADAKVAGDEIRGLRNYPIVLFNNGSFSSGDTLFSVKNFPFVSVGDTVELKLKINDNSVTYIEYLTYSGSRIVYYGRGSAGQSQKEFDIITTIPDNFYSCKIRSNSSDTSQVDVYCYLKPYDSVQNDLTDIKNTLGLKEYADIRSCNWVLLNSATSFQFISSVRKFSFIPALNTTNSGVYCSKNLTAGKKYLISFTVSSSDSNNYFILNTRLGIKYVKGNETFKGIYEPQSNAPLFFYCSSVKASTVITISDLYVYEVTNLYENNFANTFTAKISGLDFAESRLDTCSEEIYELTEKISSNRTANSVLCAVVTDTHYDENVKDTSLYKQEMQLAELIGVDFFIHLGDMVNEPAITGDTPGDVNYNRRRFNAVMEQYRTSYVPFLYTIGHHELYPYNGVVDGYSTYGFSQKLATGIAGKYGRYIKTIKQGDGYSYYFDFEDQKVRFIVLDSVSNTAMGFANSVLNWVENTALGTLPASYKVAFFAHCPTHSSLIENNPTVENGTQLESIINSFISNGGTVLGYFHGHTHFDNVAKRGNIIEIATTTEQNVVSEGMNGTLSGCPIKYFGRLWGDKTVFSIDFMLFDLDESIVKIYRFGVGKDRTISSSFTPINSSISVSETVDLSTIMKPYNSDETITWSSSNTNVATVTSGGIVTGIATGETTITATGTLTRAICKIVVS